MNKGYIKLSRQKITETRRPPQVKSSKSQIYTKFHKIPKINQYNPHREEPSFLKQFFKRFSSINLIQAFFCSQLNIINFPVAGQITNQSL
jgi:hypothetical protein